MYHELLEEIINKVTLISDEGIEEDVKGFFREDETIKEYNLKVIQNKRYELYIVLKNPSKYENEKVFFEFMQFMKHPTINIYSIANPKNGGKYIYLSATKDMRGFCFEIYFEC